MWHVYTKGVLANSKLMHVLPHLQGGCWLRQKGLRMPGQRVVHCHEPLLGAMQPPECMQLHVLTLQEPLESPCCMTVVGAQGGFLGVDQGVLQ